MSAQELIKIGIPVPKRIIRAFRRNVIGVRSLGVRAVGTRLITLIIFKDRLGVETPQGVLNQCLPQRVW